MCAVLELSGVGTFMLKYGGTCDDISHQQTLDRPEAVLVCRNIPLLCYCTVAQLDGSGVLSVGG